MGRKRKTERHLPQRVYLVHGAYYFRPKVGAAVRLGANIGEALAKHAALIGHAWAVRTMGDVIDRYRAEVLPLKGSAQTRSDQARQLTRLKKSFGDMLPDNITAQHCYRYFDARRGVSGEPIPTTARHEISLLGHVFAKAIRWGAACSNPARDLDLGPRAPKREQVTLEHVEALKRHCNERLTLAIDLAVSTGQRQGDLLGLKREAVTKEGLLVRQSKTKARVLLAWTPDLEAIIARCKAMEPQLPGEYLLRQGQGPKRGQRYTSKGFQAIWKRAMAKHVAADGVRFTFHDLRSVSADGAATAEEARDRLGHADVATTKRHYLRGVTKARPRS
jgi:integrase